MTKSNVKPKPAETTIRKIIIDIKNPKDVYMCCFCLANDATYKLNTGTDCDCTICSTCYKKHEIDKTVKVIERLPTKTKRNFRDIFHTLMNAGGGADTLYRNVGCMRDNKKGIIDFIKRIQQVSKTKIKSTEEARKKGVQIMSRLLSLAA